MDLKSTYNLIADDWAKDHAADTWWEKGTMQFCALLPPHAEILDVGCGPGTTTKYFLDHGFRAVGTDFSEKMIEIAKREVPGAEFQVMDVRDAGFEGRFDGINAKAVLLHIPKQEIRQVLENLKAKLKPGGILFLSVKEGRPGQAEEEVNVEDDYGYSYERLFTYFTRDELPAMLTGLGMEIVMDDVVSIGKTRWLTIIAKRV